MKKIGIFYGSSTGTTEEVAMRLAKTLGVSDADVKNVATSAPSDVADYDLLVLGSSTWGSGELQDDWYDFLDGLSALDLKGKQVAIFALGDESFADTFCDAAARLYDGVKSTGADLIGTFDTNGYTFDHSDAVDATGTAVGLLLDEVNHPDLTDQRIKAWSSQLL